MHMPDPVAEAFARQITVELASSAAYLQMSIFFADQNLTGMSSWMRAQSDEERDHALRFLDFAVDRGHAPSIGEVPPPATDFKGPEEVFEVALRQERQVTQAIHDLHRLALDEGDLASVPSSSTSSPSRPKRRRQWRRSSTGFASPTASPPPC